MNVISPKYTGLFPRKRSGCLVHVTTNHPWVSWWGDQSSHQDSLRSPGQLSTAAFTAQPISARWCPSHLMGSGAHAEMPLSLDLKNDATPLFQHRTMACPGGNCTVQQHGRLWWAGCRTDGLVVKQVGCLHAGKWCSALQHNTGGIFRALITEGCSETEGLN